jgi:hypothetical protein
MLTMKTRSLSSNRPPGRHHDRMPDRQTGNPVDGHDPLVSVN